MAYVKKQKVKAEVWLWSELEDIWDYIQEGLTPKAIALKYPRKEGNEWCDRAEMAGFIQRFGDNPGDYGIKVESDHPTEQWFQDYARKLLL